MNEDNKTADEIYGDGVCAVADAMQTVTALTKHVNIVLGNKKHIHGSQELEEAFEQLAKAMQGMMTVLSKQAYDVNSIVQETSIHSSSGKYAELLKTQWGVGSMKNTDMKRLQNNITILNECKNAIHKTLEKEKL